jgi:endonuclease YncB( thermonuclease family)
LGGRVQWKLSSLGDGIRHPSPLFRVAGKVVGVSDGDTITVMHDGKGEKIRLYGVDSPEKGQDYGSRAKQFTSQVVFGKTVNVKPIDQDRYGRTVGIVTYGKVNLNAELIRSGHAWLYRKYCTRPECRKWDSIEATAKSRKTGLWSMSNPVPPWEFRYNGQGSQEIGRPQTFSMNRSKTGLVYHGNVSNRDVGVFSWMRGWFTVPREGMMYAESAALIDSGCCFGSLCRTKGHHISNPRDKFQAVQDSPACRDGPNRDPIFARRTPHV